MTLNFLRKLRIANWGLVFLCFFLPFCRGCDSEIKYPYHATVESFGAFLVQVLPFVYPIFLLGLWLLLKSIPTDKLKKNILNTAYTVIFVLFTYFLVRFIYEVNVNPNVYNFDEMSNFSCLILLWGLFALSFLGRVSVERKLEVLGLNFSLYSLVALPVLSVFNKGWLIGAWIFCIANGLVVLSFVAEFFIKGPSAKKKKA